MATGLKPIETVYQGYRFRSRLEARWAVFFDALGIPWEYESEGFDLGEAGKYLPDFWLPTFGVWVEIKGSAISAADVRKVQELAKQSNQRVYVFEGQVGVPEGERSGASFRFAGGSIGKMFGSKMARWLDGECVGWVWACCAGCEALDIIGVRADMRTTHFPQACICPRCGKIQPDSPRLKRAYEAARAARFEFGEHGGVPKKTIAQTAREKWAGMGVDGPRANWGDVDGDAGQ